MVNVSLCDDGSFKDILCNVQVIGQLVIYLVGVVQVEIMNVIFVWLFYGVSEIEMVGIFIVFSVCVVLLWIVVVVVVFECEVVEIKLYLVENFNCYLIFVCVLLVYVDDVVLVDECYVDSVWFDLVGCLGGSYYSYICDMFSMIWFRQLGLVWCLQVFVDCVLVYWCLVCGLVFLLLVIGELVVFWIYFVVFQWCYDICVQCLFGQCQVCGQVLELLGLLVLVVFQDFDVVQVVGCCV